MRGRAICSSTSALGHRPVPACPVPACPVPARSLPDSLLPDNRVPEGMRVAVRPARSGDALPLRWIELQRQRVNAVALAGRQGAVVEDVAEMAAAVAAGDLGPDHAVAGVGR